MQSTSATAWSNSPSVNLNLIDDLEDEDSSDSPTPTQNEVNNLSLPLFFSFFVHKCYKHSDFQCPQIEEEKGQQIVDLTEDDLKVGNYEVDEMLMWKDSIMHKAQKENTHEEP